MGLFPVADPGDGAEEVVAAEGSAGDVEAPETVEPLVLRIDAAGIHADGGAAIDVPSAVALATATVAAGGEVRVAPAADALDRSVFELTVALDAATIPYAIEPP